MLVYEGQDNPPLQTQEWDYLCHPRGLWLLDKTVRWNNCLRWDVCVTAFGHLVLVLLDLPCSGCWTHSNFYILIFGTVEHLVRQHLRFTAEKVRFKSSFFSGAEKNRCPTQVMISWFMGSGPASGSVLPAQSLAPASDCVSLSLPLSCSHFLSKINRH